MRSVFSRTAKVAAVFAVSALALTACSSGGSSDKASGSGSGGTITAAVAYETDNYDPSSTSSALALGANWHVVEGLYELNMTDYKPYPALAKEEPKKVSDTEYEVTLRDDAKFSDGTKVTADDVVESAKRATAPDNLYASMLGFLDKVEKKDDTTVTIKLKYPFSLLKERLALIKVVKKDSTVEDNTAKPIGTGPWMYESIDQKAIKFVPNPNYNGSHPAKAKEMKWDIIKDDVARTNAMQGGTVAAMENVPFKSANQIKGSGAKVEAVQGFNLPFIMFNTKKAPFDKKETRQGVLYALDVNKMIKDAMNGEAKPAKSFLPENHPNFHPAKTQYVKDTAKAKELLKKGGAEGTSVKLLTTDHPWITALAPQVKQDLESAGLKVEVSSMASANLYANNTDTDKPDFDIVLAPGDPSVFGQDPDLLLNWWYGDNVWTQKRTQWKDSDGYKKLHAEMDKAVKSEGKAQQDAWNNAFDIVADEVPLYPLFHRQVVTAYSPDKLDGFKPIGTTGLYFIDVAAK